MSNHTTDPIKYHGELCKKCGGILRYKSNKRCISCASESTKRWRKNNPGKKREADQKWASNNPKKVKAKQKRYQQNNPDKIKARRKAWRQNNKEQIAVWMREYRRRKGVVNSSNSGGKRKGLEPKNEKWARGQVRTAVKNGIIPSVDTQRCADCGQQAKYNHHEDYSKPLEVIPLCGSCHGYRHSPYPK